MNVATFLPRVREFASPPECYIDHRWEEVEHLRDDFLIEIIGPSMRAPGGAIDAVRRYIGKAFKRRR